MGSLFSKSHSILEKGKLEYPPFGLDANGRPIRDVSGITVLANITHLEHTVEEQQGTGAGIGGTIELCRLLNERIKDPAYHVTPTFLKNTWNSYSYEFVCFMGEFCRIITNDPTFQYQVGQHYFIPSLMRTLGRPFSVSKIYSMFPHFGEKFAQGSLHFEVGEVTAQSAVLRMSLSPHVSEQFGPWRKRCAELICQSSQAGLASVPHHIHNLRPAHILTRSCISEGDACCEWELTWGRSDNRFQPLWGLAIGLFLGAGVLTLLPPSAMSLSNSSTLLITVLTVLLCVIFPTMYYLYRENRAYKQLIDDQLLTVDQQHEELREAYLQQEQTLVALKQSNAQLQSLTHTGLLLCSNFDRENLVDQVLHIAVQDLHYDRALISFFDQSSGMVSGIRLHGVTDEIERFAQSISFSVTDPTSLEGRVLLRQQPLLLTDIREEWHSLHPLNRQLVNLTQARSLIIVPLVMDDRVFGSLTVDRTAGPDLTQDDVDLIRTLGNHMAMAIDNALAYERIESMNANLESQVQERTLALERVNAKLTEQDQLKSSFVSIASHELRTPMTSIQGYVQNMLEGLTGALTNKQREYLLRISHNSERLTRLINELLDLSNIETGRVPLHRSSLRLSDLIQEALHELQTMADTKHISLSSHVPYASVFVQGDRDKIHQVLINLIHNAIRFTPSGGTVLIDTFAPQKDFVAISVSDTGSGIPSHERSKIFIPFFRGSGQGRDQKGAGLGLAISKTLIELHGGTVSVESELNAGTCFTFTLPVAST